MKSFQQVRTRYIRLQYVNKIAIKFEFIQYWPLFSLYLNTIQNKKYKKSPDIIRAFKFKKRVFRINLLWRSPQLGRSIPDFHQKTNSQQYHLERFQL